MTTRNASKLVAVAVNPEIETVVVETPKVELELVPETVPESSADAPAESAPSTESLAPDAPESEPLADAPAESAPSTESLAPDAPESEPSEPTEPVRELTEIELLDAEIAAMEAKKSAMVALRMAQAEAIRVEALAVAQAELVRLRTEFDASVGPLLAQIAALKGVSTRTTKSATGASTGVRAPSAGLPEGSYIREGRTLTVEADGAMRLDGAHVTSAGSAMKIAKPGATDSGVRFWSAGAPKA